MRTIPVHQTNLFRARPQLPTSRAEPASRQAAELDNPIHLAPELVHGAHDGHTAHSRAADTNILIFDCDPVQCAALGSWLNRAGYSVALACTADMATTLLETIVFDLAVCDCTAPYPETRRWLEAITAKPPCPLILVSEESTLELAIRAANLPVAGFLAKPIDKHALGSVINHVLGRVG